MTEMERYIGWKDLVCWLIKQGTENGRLNISKTLTLEEIMNGINSLPSVKMAEKEDLIRCGVWQMVNPDETTQTNGKFTVSMGAFSGMRDATKEERESVNKYVENISEIHVSNDAFSSMPKYKAQIIAHRMAIEVLRDVFQKIVYEMTDLMLDQS